MPSVEPIRLRLAIERLSSAATDHYAIWVVEAPYPGGYVHYDRIWTDDLKQLWQNWLQFFSLRGLPQVPHVPSAYVPQFVTDNLIEDPSATNRSYTGRLMQTLGVRLWQWLFDGAIQSSLDQSLGMALGQGSPLCLCLDIRDPYLISLPWEIMQPQPGRQALSLGENIRFSRTTSDVDPLPSCSLDQSLKILLVLGEEDVASQTPISSSSAATLQLKAEAETLKRILRGEMSSGFRNRGMTAPCQVDVLLRPSPAELIKVIERGRYNVFFYAGHGVPAPDGGLLFLNARAPLNGTELAQVLTRCRVKLAVFNTCWGAQPDQQNQEPIPRSSLAEVLLHHGVPAVLAMRDSIADEEALSFIQVFSQALAARNPVDRAVAIARQHLLTLYKFNQPAWTLPVLYVHPDFDNQLLSALDTDITRLPGEGGPVSPLAAIRVAEDHSLVWHIYGGVMRVGRRPENDLVISEPWVSSRHAEIFCRQSSGRGNATSAQKLYYLRDNSRYGTFCQGKDGWQHIHRQEVALQSGTQLRFGSPQGRLMEFVIEG
ncbi:MAG: CHAT domain-containing protein [Leptolyngbya sp. SIO1D8]|nr:CHAT domain-containing protein [Leptolyngbya sp. SIO1D8]